MTYQIYNYANQVPGPWKWLRPDPSDTSWLHVQLTYG